MSDAISIEAKPLASQMACQFILSKEIINQRVMAKVGQELHGSALFQNLFLIGEIMEIYVENNVITMKKGGNKTWQELGKQIGQAIRTSFESGESLVSEKFIEDFKNVPEVSDNELKTRIENLKTLIEKQVAPALASHGGTCELVKIVGGEVYLSFGGGCQGCAQISVTVKDGIEKIMKSEFPWVERIVDVTDHESGDNPYY